LDHIHQIVIPEIKSAVAKLVPHGIGMTDPMMQKLFDECYAAAVEEERRIRLEAALSRLNGSILHGESRLFEANYFARPNYLHQLRLKL
jgi:hypothetical protein